jgi:hypothetical protein
MHHIYIAKTTLDNEPSPYRGLHCEVIDRFGMSYAGFDCVVAFTDEEAFMERVRKFDLRREWFTAEAYGCDDATIERAAGRPVIEANFEKELVPEGSKTWLVEDLAEEMDIPVVTIVASDYDPIDFCGLPIEQMENLTPERQAELRAAGQEMIDALSDQPAEDRSPTMHFYGVYYDTCHLPGCAIVQATSPREAAELVCAAPDPNDPSCTLKRDNLQVRLLGSADGPAVLFDFHWEE